MKSVLCALALLAATRVLAAPEFVRSDARHASYARLLPDRPDPSFADAGQRQVVRLLARRASPPLAPGDVIPAENIAEIVFRAKPVNRPADFGAAEFLALWQNARLDDAVGSAEIALAPDRGFLVLADGQTVPVDLYGATALRLHGFLFRKP